MPDLLQRWYANMKRRRIPLRLRQAATTAAVMLLILYASQWLIAGAILGRGLTEMTARAAVMEALCVLAVAIGFATLYSFIESRGRVRRGLAVGALVGLLLHASLLMTDPVVAIIHVVVLGLCGAIAALIHRRNE